ncbi:MAG: hypothetical protein ABGW98_11735, partial [Myxococcales bacterium]
RAHFVAIRGRDRSALEADPRDDLGVESAPRAEGPFVAPALTASGELTFVAQQLPGISPVGLVLLAGGLLTLGVRHGRRML